MVRLTLPSESRDMNVKTLGLKVHAGCRRRLRRLAHVKGSFVSIVLTFMFVIS